MRVTGRILFGLSIAVLGAWIAGVHDFAAVWPAVPRWTPAYDAMVMLSGVLMLMGGVALLVPRAARPAAFVLAIFLFARVVTIKVPGVVLNPLVEAFWYDVGENLALAAGAWTIFSALPGGGALARFGSVRVGQMLFGLALLPIGLSHFFYLGQTAPLIPVWLPFHVALAYLTGAAHFAAGLAILFRVQARLAAMVEAVMVSLFTVLIWVPRVIAAPGVHGNWSEFCVSTMIFGAAWAVAESLRPRS